MPLLQISDGELERRRSTLLERVSDRGVRGLVLFGANNVSYLSRFHFIPTERPMALVVTESATALLVPRLEGEHAERYAYVDSVHTYPEYPGERHPMEFLKDILVELGLGNATIGVDSNGYGRIYGYRGPSVSDLLPEAKIETIGDDIEHMQMVNSEEELTLIRESARWGNLAHSFLQEYCKVGITETEISMRASFDATQAMIRTLGPSYRGGGRSGAHAGFRGQIGKDSALPHAITSNARLQAGDVLVTGAGADVDGYGSELERTMVMGEPSKEVEKYFDLMFQVQTLAMDTIKPGIPCSAVAKEVRRFFDEHDLWENWRHHSGHAKSTLVHEAPFLDIGDQRIIEVWMVFTVEPGIYVPGLGGFRHSDTVAVTEDGIEMLTYYPRDLKSLTIPI